MDMYHSWGSQNAWLRQIRGKNYLYLPTKIWQAQGFQEGDYARVTSPLGHRWSPRSPTWRVSTPTRSGPGTPSASAAAPGRSTKRRTRRKRASSSTTSSPNFCPEKGDGQRWSNSDPVTGQAAWFDLRVKIEKVGPKEHSEPQFPTLTRVVPKGRERRT